MKYSPFLQLLDSDLEPEQVLSILSKSAPSIAKKISRLLMGGSVPKDILGFLRNDKETISLPASKLRSSDPADLARILAYKNQMSGPTSQDEVDRQNLMKFSKNALGVATTLGGGYLAGRALQNAPFGQVGKKIGQSLGFQGPKTVGQEPLAEAMGSNQAIGGQVPAAASIEAVKGIPKSLINDLKVDFEKLNLGQKIEKLVATRPPEVLGGILDKQISPEQKQELEGKYGRTFPELIKDYADNYLQKAEKSPLSQESLTHQRNVANQELQVGSDKNIDEINNVPQEQENLQVYENTPTPKKESQKNVALPDGRIGEIQEERQGIATVKLPDGTLSRRKTSDLAHEPVQLEKQITDLIEAIPEDERSAVLAFASYNPGQEIEIEGKKVNIPFMGVQFHNGDFYMYPGVSKQQFDRVVSKAVKAKTTGDNPWHAWTEGKESRGAGMYELIKELEKNFGKNFIKLKAGEGYDYFKRIRQVIKNIEARKKRKES